MTDNNKSYAAVKGFNVVNKDGTVETSKGDNKGKWIPGKTSDNQYKGVYDPYRIEDEANTGNKQPEATTTPSKSKMTQTTLDSIYMKRKSKHVYPQK